MKLRRRIVADFQTPQCDDTGQTDTCELEDEKIHPQYPEQDRLALTGKDFQWAEAAIEPSTEMKGFFFMYRWGRKFTDGDGFVDVWSHGRLLVSVKRLDDGDGEIAYVANTPVSVAEILISCEAPAQRTGMLTSHSR